MMQQLSYAALLLGTIVSFASSDCTLDDGSTGMSEATQNDVLQIINDARQKLANGEQDNANTGKKLPKAVKMIDPLIWDCDLEKEATTRIGTCPGQDPEGTGKPTGAGFFYTDSEDAGPLSLEKAVTFWTKMIDTYAFQDDAYGTDKLIYSPSNNDLHLYANLMRDTTTKIGCVEQHCVDGNFMTVYCLTDQPELTKGTDAVYEVAKTTTKATTAAAATTTKSGAAAATTAPVAGATTTAPANATAGSAGTGTGESATKATKGTTTCMPISKATTPCPTYPPNAVDSRPIRAIRSSLQQQAVFDSPNAGTNNRCPQNTRMHDELRFKFLDMHNYRRAELAKGKVVKRNGDYLPQSSDMQRMEYDCALEKNVADYLSSCPSSRSTESSRPDVGENFIRVSQTGLDTYLAATENAVSSWWKVIRAEEGPGLQVYFRQKHVGTPIESFTQMGWSTSRKLGCAIAKCGSDYVAACRYSPKGNHVEQVIYRRGTPCTSCAAGAWCTEDALCTLS